MLRPSASDLKVYLHRAPIDMRAGRNGLAAHVEAAICQRSGEVPPLSWDRGAARPTRQKANIWVLESMSTKGIRSGQVTAERDR